MSETLSWSVPLLAEQIHEEEWELLRSLLQRLDEHAKAAAPPAWAEVKTKKSWAQIDHRPTRPVFLLDGERGTGKTTLLQTLVFWCEEEYWKSLPEDEQSSVQTSLGDASGVLKRLHFLPTIDFDPLPQGMPIPGAIVQRFEVVVDDLDKRRTNAAGTDLRETWRKLLRELLQAFPADGVGPQKIGYDDLVSMAVDRGEQARFWLSHGEHFRAFIDEIVTAAGIAGDHLLVMPIDDLDMQVRRTPETLWALSMLYHPRLVYLATGHTRQLVGVMDLHYRGLQADLLRGAPAEVEDLAGTLAKAVVDKLVAPAARFEVRRVRWDEATTRLKLSPSTDGDRALSLLATTLLDYPSHRSLTWRDVTQLKALTGNPLFEHLVHIQAREHGFDVHRIEDGRLRLRPGSARKLWLGLRATDVRVAPGDDGSHLAVATDLELVDAPDDGQPVGPGLRWIVELQGAKLVAARNVEAQAAHRTPLAWTERDGKPIYWPHLLPEALGQRIAAAKEWAKRAARLNMANPEEVTWAWLKWVAGEAMEPGAFPDDGEPGLSLWALRIEALRAVMVSEEDHKTVDPVQSRWFAHHLPVLAAPELAWPMLTADAILREAIDLWTKGEEPLSPTWLTWAQVAWEIWEEERRSLVNVPQEPDWFLAWTVYREFANNGGTAWVRFVFSTVAQNDSLAWDQVRWKGTRSRRRVRGAGHPGQLLWFWMEGHGDIHANACTMAVSRLVWEQRPLQREVLLLVDYVARASDSIALLLVRLWSLWCNWSSRRLKVDTSSWLKTEDGQTLVYGGPRLHLEAKPDAVSEPLIAGKIGVLRPTLWTATGGDAEIATVAYVQQALVTWLGAAQTVAWDRAGPEETEYQGFERITLQPMAVLRHGDHRLTLPTTGAWGDQEFGRWLWDRAVDRVQELLRKQVPPASLERWVFATYLHVGLKIVVGDRDARSAANLPTYPVNEDALDKLWSLADYAKMEGSPLLNEVQEWTESLLDHLPLELRDILTKPRAVPS